MAEKELRELKTHSVLLKAIMLDRTNEDEVSDYNEHIKQWVNLYYPEREETKKKEVEKMAETFKVLFRGEDGNPKEFAMRVGSDNPDIEFKDYLARVNKDSPEETKD